ncbi:50S ribosomal protein L13 [Candidatus Woesearchaeota archaeon]|nr:50S ribosomal protein L13 [Candidatus Woesearchaeota archaeon]
MIIDARDQIVGRIASFAAKKVMLGEKVDIVNCQEAIISGTKENLLAKYQHLRNLGTNPHGKPKIHRTSERFVRRIIRSMIPYKQSKGSEAFKRVMCYNTMPQTFEGKETVQFKQASLNKLPTLKYVKVKDLIILLGGKN